MTGKFLTGETGRTDAPNASNAHRQNRRSSQRALRAWSVAHRWTSLVCTAFMLLLCLAGLPLVFGHELDLLTGDAIEAPELPASQADARARYDAVLRAALDAHPGHVAQYMIWEPDAPLLPVVVTAPRADTPPDDTSSTTVDARTAKPLGTPPGKGSLKFVLLKLHVDMFAGLFGKLFLGAMGVVFLAAIVSGVVVYLPFWRKVGLGRVRFSKKRRIVWLDWHNAIGMLTLAWALLVGATGSINTLADLMLDAWRNDQLAQMLAPYRGQPALAARASVDDAVNVARGVAPGIIPSFVAFPGTRFSSPHHYAVWMRGDGILTTRILRPVLVDARTGALTDSRELPWYLKVLLGSQPLHFGDFGGMPLKLFWAAFDVLTVVVLGSGLYLWATRHNARKGGRAG
ncbi:PepSY domain-containing protein [Caballeronia sp. Lep1P3]|uniref:PepSY-associated TM helix domain-containing protein n=1 Tax=Caballeronia sp. Lep1P3 TaxID=2878150 RepID=UPI001FD2A43A|nr:PepSY-associated TM helix domain-containing protein [Caballeronia sp. Lep1P3]